SIPEEEGENGHPVYIARTYRDAPDVDGLLFLPYVQRDHESGDMIKVLITAAKGYDLIGKEVEA
ncbi:MAG: 30S ribosomal protein S12 methylthiotransferase RimO, partial [Lachnospiraceae bacterium]|nr:30S ribosomal protein S12 methylthiotransferase RimO [Lachnospiraceae bacterium]